MSEKRWLLRRRPACAVVAMCVAGLALGPAPAGAQCGQTTEVNARRSLGPGPPPLAVGDSVLYAAAPMLGGYGFTSNAMVCRTMAQGIAWLEARGGPLPAVVVVALGTNGTVTTGQIDGLLRIVGSGRLLALVTPHHGVSPGVPDLFRTAAREHAGQIVVLDWDRLSAGHADWFAPDGIHLGGAAGIAAYAHLVASALTATPGQVASPTVQNTAPARPVVTPKAAAKPKQGVRPAAQPRAQRPSTELIHIDGLAWSVFIDAVTSAVQFAG